MKKLASLILVALFALVNSQSTSAQQGQLERNILGVVYEENEQPQNKEDKQQNKDSAVVTVVSEVKLKTPVNRVEVELSEEATKAAQIIPLDGWQAVKGKKGITWTTDLPTTTFRLHVDFPTSLGNKLDGRKLNFRLGDNTIGTLTLKDPKKAPLNVITNLDEAGTFPSGLRPGDFNSFVPQEKFANGGNGNWFARLLGTGQGANRNPDKLTGASQDGITLISDEKDGNVIPATPGLTDEDFRRGVDYMPGRYLPLDQRYTDQPGGAPPKTAQDAKPPLGFFIPGTVPPGTEVEVGFIDRFGRRLVVGKATVTPDGGMDFGLPPFLITCTPKIFKRDKLCVCGSFPTQFSRNQLLLDGKPLGSPLAGSRDTLVFQPEVPFGRHVITWNVDAFKQWPQPGDELRPPPSTEEKVEFVLLDVKGAIDRNKLFTGEGTTLRLEILGTKEQLPIELTNKTPQIIDMEGGPSQVVKSSGGAPNIIERQVKGTMRGNFDIVYRLALPPCPCNPELTSEVGRVVGRVKPGSPTTNVPDRKSCEELVAQCDRLEEEWQKLEGAYQQALDGCPDENCINAVKVAYETKVKEAYRIFSRCLERSKECYRLLQIAPTGPQAGPANNPSTPEGQEPEGEEDCDKIKKRCQELADRLDVLKRVKNQLESIARACAQVKSDQQAKENCKNTVTDSYASMIKTLEQELAACTKRVEECLDPFQEQDDNVEATTEEECQKLRKGCEALEAEEKQFMEFLNNKLTECATEYKSPAALEACKRAVNWKYQEALLGTKESLQMCRKRVTDCVSRLRPRRP